MSGIREQRERKHHPFLIFVANEADVEVRIGTSPVGLLRYSDETKVMCQWGGNYRSDFFQFTVGDLRTYIAKHPPAPYQVI